MRFLHFYIVKLRLKAKEYLVLKRNHDLEIKTNQMFKFLNHSDIVLYRDYDKIIIINEDDFDHDEKGLIVTRAQGFGRLVKQEE